MNKIRVLLAVLFGALSFWPSTKFVEYFNPMPFVPFAEFFMAIVVVIMVYYADLSLMNDSNEDEDSLMSIPERLIFAIFITVATECAILLFAALLFTVV